MYISIYIYIYIYIVMCFLYALHESGVAIARRLSQLPIQTTNIYTFVCISIYRYLYISIYMYTRIYRDMLYVCIAQKQHSICARTQLIALTVTNICIFVFISTYICTYIHIYVYIYIHIYRDVLFVCVAQTRNCICARTQLIAFPGDICVSYICICIYVYVYIYMHINICKYLCKNICMHECMYTCKYTFILLSFPYASRDRGIVCARELKQMHLHVTHIHQFIYLYYV